MRGLATAALFWAAGTGPVLATEPVPLVTMQKMAVSNSMGAYTQELADAVKFVVGTKSGIDFIGGLSPVLMAEGYGYGLLGGNPPQAAGAFTHLCCFMRDIGNTMVPSLIAVHFGTAHIYTNHVIEVGS